MNKDTIGKEIAIWIKGIPYELAFWNNVWRHSSGMRDRILYGKTIKLDGFDVSGFLALQENPVVLDVGCGMSFSTGDRIATPSGYKSVEVHYLDPLACFYNKIKNRYRKDAPEIEFGMMECLSSFFSTGDAALIIMKNALDHSANPIKGIVEALSVLKIGGVLYLKHYQNEARTERYNGFHKFNVCINEEGQLLIWNLEQRYVVDELISDFAEISTVLTSNGFVVSTIKKKKDVSEGLLISNKEDKREIVEFVINQVVNSISFEFILVMKMKYFFYNVIQFFVQLLSKRNKQILRHIVYEARID